MLLLASAGYADRVPIRWGSADPATFDLLAGTPVNCVLLDGNLWKPDLIEAAKHRGFAVEHDVPFLPRRELRLDATTGVVATNQGVWPGIEIEHGGKVLAGPSAAPWVFTNGGFLRFVRASTDLPVWIDVKPPEGNIYPAARYVQAIADAAIYGARWVINFPPGFWARLEKRDANALADWKNIMSAAAFLEKNGESRHWPEWSEFGVLQSRESGGLLTGSLLDMVASQRTSVRPVPLERLGPETLAGIRILLDVDPAALNASQRDTVEAFRKAGGQVIDPPDKWRFPAVPESEIMLGHRQLDEMQPLWEITYKATVRKNFGVRTFNTTSVSTNAVASPDGKTVVVYLVNYTDGPVESVTVHARGEWKQATLLEPGGKSKSLEIYPAALGSGVDIETLGSLAVVRFER
jgi:hypothetical protein